MLLKLFGRLGLLIFLLGVGLSVALPALGGRPPINDPAWEQFGFAYCGLPCFAGVTPGETVSDDAASLLYQHIPTIERGMFNTGSTLYFAATLTSQRLGGVMLYGHSTVSEFQLNVFLPLEQLINELGLPDCLLPEPGSQNTTDVFWTRGAVSIAAVLPRSEHFDLKRKRWRCGYTWCSRATARCGGRSPGTGSRRCGSMCSTRDKSKGRQLAVPCGQSDGGH